MSMTEGMDLQPMRGPGAMIDLSQRPKRTTVIQFKSVEDETGLVVEVHDKFPHMDTIHIEGRRYVEVSVEMFVQLMALAGYQPVAPEAEPEVPVVDPEEGDEF